MNGGIPGIALRHPGVGAEVFATQEHHAEIAPGQVDLALDIHHRVFTPKRLDLTHQRIIGLICLDDPHAPGLGGEQRLEDRAAEIFNRCHRGGRVLGNPGIGHRDARIAQGDGATQPIDQPQHVLGTAEYLHAGPLRNPQQLEPVQRVRAVLGADLFHHQPVQAAQIISVEHEPVFRQVECDLRHVDDQAKAGAPLDRIGQRFCRPFSRYAYHTDPGISQRKSPPVES